MKTVCFVVLMLLVAAGVVGAADIALGAACTSEDTCASAAICDPLQHKCALKVGGDCSANNDNCVDGAECKSNFCACKSGHTATTGKVCAADTKIKGTCTGDGRGNCADANAECTGNTCSCKTGYTGPDGGSCAVIAGKKGGSCTSTDCDDNAECKSGTCSCKPHFTAEIGQACAAITPGELEGKCVDNGCKANNTICVNTYCKCDEGFSPSDANICEKNSAGDLVITLTSLVLAAIAGLMMRA